MTDLDDLIARLKSECKRWEALTQSSWDHANKDNIVPQQREGCMSTEVITTSSPQSTEASCRPEAVRSRIATKKPIRAYSVTSEYDSTGGIVFAKTKAEARRKGSAQYGDGDFHWGSARRAPWADEYVNSGHVPLIVMLSHGWHFKCGFCSQMIEEGAQDDDGNDIEFDPVEVGDTLYCRPECRNDYVWQKNRLRAFECTVIDDLYTELLKLAPGAWIVGKPHVYATGEPLVAQQGIIGFRFPGCKIGDAHFRFDKAGEKPHVTVCYGDRAAWEAWRTTSTTTPQVCTPAQAVPEGEAKGKEL